MESVLTVIKKYQKEAEILPKKSLTTYNSERPLRKIGIPEKRTSKVDLVAEILEKEDRPLHISEILEIANRDYKRPMERDSIVSMLVKKYKAGKKFIRTAPNTFSLKGANG
jgi:predicted transcriptional regulator